MRVDKFIKNIFLPNPKPPKSNEVKEKTGQDIKVAAVAAARIPKENKAKSANRPKIQSFNVQNASKEKPLTKAQENLLKQLI